MQTKSQTKKKKTSVSQDILHLLREAGPQGMKVQEVADKMGISRIAAYVWFISSGKVLTKKLSPGVYSAATMEEAHLEHVTRFKKQASNRSSATETVEMIPELVTAAPEPKSAKQEMLSEIQALRKRGWTACALAERLRVPARTLQRWLLGKILPPCWVCRKLVAELQEIGWENPPSKKTVSTSINGFERI